MNSLEISEAYWSAWRREWDSNPRYGFPHTRFPSVRLKPLGHLSGCPVLKGQDDFCKRRRRRRPRFPQITEWPGQFDVLISVGPWFSGALNRKPVPGDDLSMATNRL